ncbi:hypothetical protein BP5796_03878 [Coleophoma crateriformis]|uniref:Uncharacterized protein n=1 Tax=Coleophoma crateriformis TaxID=565419 RepID=A0A3D8SGY1_9HELO|nr:hypothetical protein BP5796_03878 [Coleophoma crateriformis]
MSKFQQGLSRRVNAVRAAFESKDAFIKAIETSESAVGRLEERNPYRNEDLDISPPAHWTWAWYDYAAFWWAYGFSPGVWSVGSSLISVGLTSWQALICVFIGYSLGALGVVLHSRSAATYHFGFPVESRIPWGLRAAYFPVLVRVMTATIWVGISLTQGGYFVAVLLRCIFGHRFSDIPNHIPTSAGITTQQLIGLVIIWFGSLPLLSVPIPKVRRIFSVKSIILPPVTIGLFAYCMWKGRGKSHEGFTSTTNMNGSALAWAMLNGVNSVMGKTSTLVVNQPDIARYARTRNTPLWSQALGLPIGNTACAALGIYATTAIEAAWGKAYWNPWDLLNEILNRQWNAGTRTWVAIVNLGFILSQVAGNLGANVIPWGADAMTFYPRFLNIERGMYLAYILGVCIVPWKILKSASSFLAFLGGYSIFLGPFLGIFITDYFVIRKGNVYVKDLYETKGRYWYWHGVSWRAVVAYLFAVVWTLPGFTSVFGNTVPAGWMKLYKLSWIFTCAVSSVVYFGVCMIGGFAKEDRAMAFEQVYHEGEYLDGREPESEEPSEIDFVDMSANTRKGIEK